MRSRWVALFLVVFAEFRCESFHIQVGIGTRVDFAQAQADTALVGVNADDAQGEHVAFLDSFTTKTEQHNVVLAYMQDNGASTEEAAMFFLKEYEDWWTKWVPADIATAVKAAL